MDAEVPLGGRVTRPVRVGDRVRRGTGPWTPAVHALLRHLADAGFDGAPRVLGVDDDGREVLTFVEGDSPATNVVAPAMATDDCLVAAAALVRRYHDAVRTFRPPADAVWRRPTRWPAGAELVCHNDLGPYNTVYRGGRPVAFVDWDLAAPAPAVWDVAHAAWRYTPLCDDATAEAHGWPPADRGRRLRLFCDGYGLPWAERDALLDVVAERMAAVSAAVREWAAAGVPGFADMAAEEGGLAADRDLAHLAARRAEWAARLRSPTAGR